MNGKTHLFQMTIKQIMYILTIAVHVLTKTKRT